MKIRLNVTAGGEAKGAIIERPNSVAELLIERGAAEAFEAEQVKTRSDRKVPRRDRTTKPEPTDDSSPE
ncbi:hypothetical protein [Brachybacterium alimentarium]|uniref:hypothetical protein n=1 Tax=Brachybacterium alimentarium TaxID=47845 RepID=UPI000DF4AD81|nr:hypothetical protein [Brachybacterium alimentarium]RCS78868.1 hypothetical protein CIK67_18230 [Brachybacterium alimentarium]